MTSEKARIQRAPTTLKTRDRLVQENAAACHWEISSPGKTPLRISKCCSVRGGGGARPVYSGFKLRCEEPCMLDPVPVLSTVVIFPKENFQTFQTCVFGCPEQYVFSSKHDFLVTPSELLKSRYAPCGVFFGRGFFRQVAQTAGT